MSMDFTIVAAPPQWFIMFKLQCYRDIATFSLFMSCSLPLVAGTVWYCFHVHSLGIKRERARRNAAACRVVEALFGWWIIEMGAWDVHE